MNITSRSSRASLPHRREPYWARVNAGQFIGYRTSTTGDGNWIARFRDADGKQHYRSLGQFEDFDAAVAAARIHFEHVERTDTPKVLTVAEVCRGYVAWLKAAGRTAAAVDAEGRFRRLVFDAPIGRISMDRLRKAHVESWLHDQATGGTRASKDSANRNLRALKAALNRAYKSGDVASDQAWRSVEPFSRTTARRPDAFLDKSQIAKLIEHADDDLSRLIRAALHTGARPGELAKMTAGDFDKRRGLLHFDGKTGARDVPISNVARVFFSEIARDKLPSAPMLTCAGRGWTKESWCDAFAAARDAAGLPAAVTMYSLRHTAISMMLAGGLGLLDAGKVTGTSVEMIGRHYGHLALGSVLDKLNAIEVLA